MKTIGKLDTMMAALDSAITQEVHDDEFTVYDFCDLSKEQGKPICRQSASEHLRRLVANGELKCRKVNIKGKICNVYSAP